MYLFDAQEHQIVYPHGDAVVRHVPTGKTGIWRGRIGFTSDGMIVLRVEGETREHSWSPEDVVVEPPGRF